jgi:hypothetical protein
VVLVLEVGMFLATMMVALSPPRELELTLRALVHGHRASVSSYQH